MTAPASTAPSEGLDHALFQELFSHGQLVADLTKTTSIDEFLDWLTGITIAGRRLAQAGSRRFLAINGLGEVPRGAECDDSEIAQLHGHFLARVDELKCVGAAEGFVKYVREFVSSFAFLARWDLSAPARQHGQDETLARMLDYLDVQGLVRSSARNVVDFCGSDSLYAYLATIVGHNAITTDIGGASQDKSYGFGAKVFLRTALLGSKVVNYTLDCRDLRSACAIPWFKDGIDVFAVHGAPIDAGRRVAWRLGPGDAKRCVSQVMELITPCMRTLQKRQGVLNLRHVDLFQGHAKDMRAELSEALAARITRELGASVILCGEDPFPSPWAEEFDGRFSHALVLKW
jgi:hypothetical protein